MCTDAVGLMAVPLVYAASVIFPTADTEIPWTFYSCCFLVLLLGVLPLRHSSSSGGRYAIGTSFVPAGSIAATAMFNAQVGHTSSSGACPAHTDKSSTDHDCCMYGNLDVFFY